MTDGVASAKTAPIDVYAERMHSTAAGRVVL